MKDAQTTSKIILNKWFARHVTPARVQSDNATKFTAEIAQELKKVSEVTKVTSTPAHPRGDGLVERQNRTLLTLSLYIAQVARLGRGHRWSLGRLQLDPPCNNRSFALHAPTWS